MLKKLKKILVLGDSLLRGVVIGQDKKYVQLPDSSVSEVERTVRVDIENSSMFGMTAKKALSRFFQKPRNLSGYAVLIEYGGNDCNFDWKQISERPLDEHLPVTPLDEFESNLLNMVKTTRNAGGFPVLMTLPPIHAPKFLDWVTRNGESRENILLWLGDTEHIYRWQERYNLAINRVALSTGTPIIDVRERFLSYGRYEDYLCEDGMHVNKLGHMLMADTFISFVNKHRHLFEDNPESANLKLESGHA